MTNRTTRRQILAGAAAAATLSAATLTAPRLARAAAVPLSFQFDWKFNAQFAGVFKAIDAGLYSAAGLEMSPRPWADGVNVVAEVAEGRADFACAEQNLIIAAQAEGAPVRAVATMFQASPYGLMTLPGGTLTGLSDLSGQTVGVHLDGVKIMAMVMGVNGISDIAVTEIPYADKFARVQSGELAAVQCYVIDEPIGVAKAIGAEPLVLRLSDAGLVSTAQTIVVSEKMLADSPEMVRAAMAATFEGWTQTLADKPGTATMVVERFVEDGSPYKDVAYQTRTLELLEPYVMAGGIPGRIDPGAWVRAAQLMLDYGIVTALPDLSASLAEGFVG